MASFHKNQILAAGDIISGLMDTPFLVLLAQMQSGKTGTYLRVAFEMLRRRTIKRVIILCGSSDKSLRQQAIEALTEGKHEFIADNFPREERKDIRPLFKNIKVFFSQDLKEIPIIDGDTLVIHEESHMAQSKDNLPFKNFYFKNSLNGALTGEFDVLRKKRIFILSVSATPFSEIVVNRKVLAGDWTGDENAFLTNVHLQEKVFYFMQPGEGYIGVSQLLEANCIKFTSSVINSDDCLHIAKVLGENREKYKCKYCVIRTHRAERDAAVIKSLASSMGYDYTSIFSGAGTTLDFMETAPFKATIIQICGRFRMGQVVPKEHVAMVYEQSHNPNADTILQGLLGRMCGYHEEGAHTNMDIFTSPSSEECIRKYSRAWSEGGSGIEELSTITKAMNLGGCKRHNGGTIVYDKDRIPWIATVPIQFSLTQLWTADDTGARVTFTSIKARDIENMLRAYPDLIDGNFDQEEIFNLLRIIQERDVNPREQIHHNKSFKQDNRNSIDTSEIHYAAYTAAAADKVRMNITTVGQNSNRWTTTEFKGNSISVYGSKPGTPGNVEGICFLLAYVEHREGFHPLISTELAAVNPRCNYIPGYPKMEDESILKDTNGAQHICLSSNTSEDPQLFERILIEAIFRTKEDIDRSSGEPDFVPGAVSAIHSLYDRESSRYDGIRLAKTSYTEESIKAITQSIETKYGVTLKFNKARGRQPKDHFKYASISW